MACGGCLSKYATVRPEFCSTGLAKVSLLRWSNSRVSIALVLSCSERIGADRKGKAVGWVGAGNLGWVDDGAIWGILAGA